MAWYDTGTVSVTNGSTTVTGSGTNFVAGVQVGEAFYGPDDRIYEIQAIVSSTSLTLADVYLGATQSGQAYKIVPTQSLVADLTGQVITLINDFQTVADEAGEGKFSDGSAASPAITFTQDQDTGFYRAGANQLGAATGGVMRWLLSSTALQVNVPVTGSAVQSSATDTTAGKLLTVGAFGLGGEDDSGAVVSDGLSSLPSGMYGGPGGAGTNFPSSTKYRPFLNLNRRSGAGTFYTARMFFDVDGVPIVKESVDGSGAVWSAANTLYGTANLLGTVSQSGGVPTGKVIERGSNANGEYVRFADGAQICVCEKASTDAQNVAVGSLYRTDGEALTFPAAFSTTTGLSVMPGFTGDTAAWFTCDAPTTTSVHTRRVGIFNMAIDVTYRIVAIGRWF